MSMGTDVQVEEIKTVESVESVESVEIIETDQEPRETTSASGQACRESQRESEAETERMAMKREQHIESLVRLFWQNKQMIKERQSDNKDILEELQYLLEEETEKTEWVVSINPDESVSLQRKVQSREVLDKQSLAEEALLSVSDLKTPFDFSILTKQDKITPSMISQHTKLMIKKGCKIVKYKEKKHKKRGGSH